MLVGEVPREVILELGLQVPGRSLGLGLRHTSPLCLPSSRPYGACGQVILWGAHPCFLFGHALSRRLL